MRRRPQRQQVTLFLRGREVLGFRNVASTRRAASSCAVAPRAGANAAATNVDRMIMGCVGAASHRRSCRALPRLLGVHREWFVLRLQGAARQPRRVHHDRRLHHIRDRLLLRCTADQRCGSRVRSRRAVMRKQGRQHVRPRRSNRARAADPGWQDSLERHHDLRALCASGQHRHVPDLRPVAANATRRGMSGVREPYDFLSCRCRPETQQEVEE